MLGTKSVVFLVGMIGVAAGLAVGVAWMSTYAVPESREASAALDFDNENNCNGSPVDLRRTTDVHSVCFGVNVSEPIAWKRDDRGLATTRTVWTPVYWYPQRAFDDQLVSWTQRDGEDHATKVVLQDNFQSAGRSPRSSDDPYVRACGKDAFLGVGESNECRTQNPGSECTVARLWCAGRDLYSVDVSKTDFVDALQSSLVVARVLTHRHNVVARDVNVEAVGDTPS